MQSDGFFCIIITIDFLDNYRYLLDFCFFYGYDGRREMKKEDREMINFDEEIEKFQPSPEIEQAEDVIYKNDMTDISDILRDLLKGNKEN